MAIGWVLFWRGAVSLPLRPLADRLARYRVPRGVTVLGAYLVGIALLVGLGYLLTPIINQQITYLQSNGASLLQTATSRLANSALARWIPSSTTLTQELSQRLNTLATGAVAALATVGDLLLELSVVFILAFFLVAEEGRWRERLILPWFSPARQVRIQQVLENSGRRLSCWQFFIRFPHGETLEEGIFIDCRLLVFHHVFLVFSPCCCCELQFVVSCNFIDSILESFQPFCHV